MDPLIVCNEECVFITDVVAGYNATEIKKKTLKFYSSKEQIKHSKKGKLFYYNCTV